MLLYILIFLFSIHQFSAQEIKRIKITDLEETIRTNDGPMIINFWATFCKPCIEELPYFQSLTKKYADKGVQLLLVSLDLEEAFPKKIAAFAGKQKISTPIVWLDEYDADYFCPKVDSSWSGAIPASLFVNPQNGYRRFFEEQLSEKKLERIITEMLAPVVNESIK